MFALARLVVMGFIALTVIYVCLSFYSRSVRRSKLRKKWYQGKQLVDRDTFVQRGLDRYDRSLRRHLNLGVYIVPGVVVGVIIYLTNFS